MGLRSFFDGIEPHFEKGGKWERYFPIYEMVESFLYTPKTVTTAAPHARSYIDMKRIMTYVVLSTIPCILMGCYNVGLQTNMGIAEHGASGWRAAIMGATFGLNPANPLANLMHGLMYFLPIYITTLVAGGIWEVIFATVRRHEVNEGFLVTSMLYALILPASTPLWQVALGISFGVVIGKEVFGGTGKNFLNPAFAGGPSSTSPTLRRCPATRSGRRSTGSRAPPLWAFRRPRGSRAWPSTGSPGGRRLSARSRARSARPRPSPAPWASCSCLSPRSPTTGWWWGAWAE